MTSWRVGGRAKMESGRNWREGVSQCRRMKSLGGVATRVPHHGQDVRDYLLGVVRVCPMKELVPKVALTYPFHLYVSPGRHQCCQGAGL